MLNSTVTHDEQLESLKKRNKKCIQAISWLDGEPASTFEGVPTEIEYSSSTDTLSIIKGDIHPENLTIVSLNINHYTVSILIEVEIGRPVGIDLINATQKKSNSAEDLMLIHGMIYSGRPSLCEVKAECTFSWHLRDENGFSRTSPIGKIMALVGDAVSARQRRFA